MDSDCLKFSKNLTGCKILISTSDGDFEGIVEYVSPDVSMISLKKVYSHEAQRHILGLSNFFGREILSCRVLEQNKKLNKTETIDEEDGPKLLRVRPLPTHLQKLESCHTQRKEVFICHPSENSESDKAVKEGTIKLPNNEDLGLHQLKIPLPETFIVIDELGDAFHTGIQHLKTQDTIGIGAQGLEIGRKGKLCVLVVVTRQYTYLFDILALGKDAFKNGLKEILESERIEKVMHNCRSLSDALFHIYGVNLCNVFDTQVADVFLYQKQHNGEVPEYVKGLASCLSTYLNLTSDQTNFLRLRPNVYRDEALNWTVRPLSLKYIDVAVKHTLYLLELKRVCFNLFFADFRSAVKTYLQSLKDASEEEYSLHREYTLPPSLEKTLVQCRKSFAFQRNPRYRQKNEAFLKNKILQDDDLQLYFGSHGHSDELSEDMFRFTTQKGQARNHYKDDRRNRNGFQKFNGHSKGESKASMEYKSGFSGFPRRNKDYHDDDRTVPADSILEIGRTGKVPRPQRSVSSDQCDVEDSPFHSVSPLHSNEMNGFTPLKQEPKSYKFLPAGMIGN